MKGRRRRWLRFAVLGVSALALLLPLTAAAQSERELFDEQREASGAQELWEQMPQEIRGQLENLGITEVAPEGITALQPETVGSSLWSLVLQEAGGPLRMGGVLLGVLILCAAAEGMRTLSDRLMAQSVFQTVTSVAVCVTVLPELLGCIGRVSEAVTGCTVFMGSFVPVYAAVLAASGRAASALSFQSVVLCVAEWMTVLIRQWITPLVTVSLALGAVGSAGTPWKLSAVGDCLHKLCTWGLGLLGTVFTGLLSVQNMTGEAADTLASRTLRFSVANLVPVVGGAVSEALGTVRGCLGLLRSSLGGIGILSVVLLVGPPLLSCVWWLLMLSLCGAAAELLLQKPIADWMRSVAGTVKTLIAVLVICALFLIVAVTVVHGAGGGTAG